MVCISKSEVNTLGCDRRLLNFLDNLDRDLDLKICEYGPDTAERFFDLDDSLALQFPKYAFFCDPKSGRSFGFFVHQKALGRVFIDLNSYSVTKKVEKFKEFGLLSREIEWLSRLSASERFPKVLRYDEDVVGTNYLGEPLRAHNLPRDWEKQAEIILSDLKKAGCSHNDIKCDNLVVMSGKISLIDFGWSTEIGSRIPSDWPKSLGSRFKVSTHQFDDRYALFSACRTLLEFA